MKWYLIITAIVLVFLYFGLKDVFNQEYSPAGQSGTTAPLEISIAATNNKNMAIQPPGMVIDVNKNYGVLLKTDQGDIKIALNTQGTPTTTNNFIYLAQNNFYNGVIFHRVINGFMIQGGDPLGTGAGGPGYEFADEPFTGEYVRGMVAMANHGPNTNGSQFFIMHADAPALPKNYVIFGRVYEGMEVVDQIATAPVQVNATGEMSQPISPVKINSMEILEL